MIKVEEHVPLAPLTTFEIGGAARYFTEIKTETELEEAIFWARERNISHIIFGGGSNVLVPDEGLNALVIKISIEGMDFGGVEQWVGAGVNLLSAIRASSDATVGGWEKLAGIPGTIGGAVRGNAGAFGSEIKDFVEKVRAVHSETGEEKEFTNEECDFSYRHSYFKDHPEWVITGVFLNLGGAEAEESKRLAEETILEREKRHLQNVRAAGSYFMNPVAPKNVVEMFEKEKQVTSRGGRVPAGWLIEKSGMKGATVGGAIASLQHPNYLVNQGSATAKEVRELAEKVKNAVEEKFGVRLQEEAMVF